MDRKEVKTLAITAAKARLLAVEAVHRCASGHPGGSLSVLDVLTVLYFHTMRVDPQNPADPDRDRFVLSKGHCTPALYATLALRGYYAVEELELFRSIKGHMSGHPDMVNVKGVDMSTGSLGQGISAAVGMAIAGKLDGKDYRVYAALGDGEIEEGQRIALKYGKDKNERIISGIKKISKPGLRVYAGKEDMPKVLGGLGIAIVSTNHGVITDREARELGVGGEVLAFVW